MPRRAAMLVLVAALALPAGALADGDPASDVLPTQDAYYPYAPQPATELVQTLDDLLADVRKKGYPMKVALIATAGDLGAYPQLFNDPQRYADLLSSELPDNPHGNVREALHLLVVMPAGFGGKNLGDGVDRALDPVEIDADAQSDGLARAAIEAVANIASENGFETPVPDMPEIGSASDDDSGGGAGTAGIVLAAVAVLLLIVGLAAARLRGRDEPEGPLDPASAEPEGSDERPPAEPGAQGPRPGADST